MISPTGSITINGITDKELARIWEFKARNEKAFTFQPQTMQPLQTQGEPYYNNVSFSWSSEPGLAIVHEILGFLLKKEERGEKAQ